MSLTCYYVTHKRLKISQRRTGTLLHEISTFVVTKEFICIIVIQNWGTLHISGSNLSLTDTCVAAVVVASVFKNFVHRCLRVFYETPTIQRALCPQCNTLPVGVIQAFQAFRVSVKQAFVCFVH